MSITSRQCSDGRVPLLFVGVNRASQILGTSQRDEREICECLDESGKDYSAGSDAPGMAPGRTDRDGSVSIEGNGVARGAWEQGAVCNSSLRVQP